MRWWLLLGWLLLAPSLALAAETGTVHVLHVHPAKGADFYDMSVAWDRGGRCQVSRKADPDTRFQEGDRVLVTKPCVIAPLRVLASGPQRSVGNYPTVLLLVNFTNDRSEPMSPALAQSWFASTEQFYQANSYGTVTLPVTVAGWLKLPIPNTGCPYINIQTQAETLASAAGVPSSVRRIYLFPYIAACGWSGLGTVGGNPSAAWINGPSQWGAMDHEIGHNFGLYHSHGLRCGAAWPNGSIITPPCTINEYGDIRDTMGAGGPFNAFQKLRLGWLGQPGLPSVTAVSQSGDYTIADYEGPVTATPKALTVPRGTTGETFYIEQHTAAPGRTTAGVYVRLATAGQPNSSKLLDMTPTIPWGLGSGLPVGATFTDPVSGVRLSVLSNDAQEAVVRVQLTGAPPPPPPPPPPGDGTVAITHMSSLGREMTFSGTLTGALAITASVDGSAIAARYITVDRVRKTWSVKASALYPGPHVFTVATGTMAASVAFRVLK